MPVDTKRVEYTASSQIWQRCRDTAGGQDKVKAAGTVYLPPLGPIKTPDDEVAYQAYKARGYFYNATSRTIAGLSGMLFQKDPVVDAGRVTGISQNIAVIEVGVDEFAQHAADEVLEVGRGGTLVDFPELDRPMSQAEAEAQDRRPIWAWYDAEMIINWRYEKVGSANKLVLLVLKEQSAEENKDDEFETEYVTYYRVLKIDENGYYQQMLYRETTEKKLPARGANEIPTVSFVSVWDEPRYPKQSGQNMKEIPFVWFAPVNRGAEIQKPPLLDMINLNIAHYQQKTDQRHGLHYAALPTPVLTGVQQQDAPEKIGPQEMWVLPSSDARASMLEAQLPGMDKIDKELKSLEWQMATLGARMLAPDQVTYETATAAQIRHIGETSSLADISRSVSNSMTLVLKITDEWLGGDGDVTYEMSTDFMPVQMSGQDLTALVDSWLRGAISKQTLFENLQKGEIVAADKTFEEEENEIDISVTP